MKHLLIASLIATLATPALAQQDLTEELLGALDGKAKISAGAYLGLISSDQFKPDSICNPNGLNGSRDSFTSIRNKNSAYGNYTSELSVNNPDAKYPPQINFWWRNQAVNVYLSKNKDLSPRIDPDELISAMCK